MNLGSTELLVIVVVGVIVVAPVVAVVVVLRKTGGGAAASSSPAPAPPPPAGPPADGWYPDPTGRHQQRWFSDGRWGIQVADDGTVGTDPL